MTDADDILFDAVELGDETLENRADSRRTFSLSNDNTARWRRRNSRR